MTALWPAGAEQRVTPMRSIAPGCVSNWRPIAASIGDGEILSALRESSSTAGICDGPLSLRSAGSSRPEGESSSTAQAAVALHFVFWQIYKFEASYHFQASGAGVSIPAKRTVYLSLKIPHQCSFLRSHARLAFPVTGNVSSVPSNSTAGGNNVCFVILCTLMCSSPNCVC